MQCYCAHDNTVVSDLQILSSLYICAQTRQKQEKHMWKKTELLKCVSCWQVSTAACSRQTPSKRRTHGQADTGNRIWCILALKCDIRCMAIIFTNFLTINWSNFVYLLVDPGLCPSPLKFLRSIAVRSPYWMDAQADRHNGPRDKQTNERTDGQSVRLLDGVWPFPVHLCANNIYENTRSTVWHRWLCAVSPYN